MGMSDFYRGLRDQVGNALLMMPAVAALIRDEAGRILLQMRPDGTWSLPAGAIEPGETPARAVVREIEEETGLVVRPVRIAGVVGGTSRRVTYDNGHVVEYTVTVFDCAIEGGDLIESNEETRALEYVPVAEAIKRLPFPYPAAVFDPNRAGAYFELDGPER